MRSERVLISLKGYIGDAVMALPLLEEAERHFENIEVMTTPVVQEVLWSPLRHRQFISFSASRKVKDVVHQARELRKRRFDTAILVNHSFRSALIARMAGIRRIIGHPTEGRRVFLNRAVAYDEQEWEAWSYLDLLRPLNIDAERVRPKLAVSEEERAWGARALAGATVGVQPAARYSEKEIPELVSEQVIRRLQELRFSVSLLGGKDEVERASRVMMALPEAPVNLVGTGSIRQALGVLSNLQLMIGGDTGLMHLSAAVGCPSITVFGPTVASKWAHDYPPHQVIRAKSGNIANVEANEILEAALRVLH